MAIDYIKKINYDALRTMFKLRPKDKLHFYFFNFIIMTNTTFSIPEIHCMSCEALIRLSLKKMPGITSVTTNLKTKTATIDFDDKFVHKEQIQQQIQKETWYKVS